MDQFVKRFFDLSDSDPEQMIAVGPDWSWSRGEVALDVSKRGEEVARFLRSSKLQPGSVLALQVSGGPGFLSAFLAARKAGACVLLLDGDTPDNEQLRLANSLGACAVWKPTGALCGPSVMDELKPLGGSAAFPEAACLRLSSGSTGEPAGIITPAHAAATMPFDSDQQECARKAKHESNPTRK